MVFIACGLNHQSAPIAIREKFSIPTTEQTFLLQELVKIPKIYEAAILSTCNRTEIYCDTEDSSILIPWLLSNQNLNTHFAEHFYTHQGPQGIRHAMRVASGLDSMIPGETQIFGQLKAAFQRGVQAGTVKKNLHHAFQHIFSAGKRVRHESELGQAPISIAYAASQLVKELFCNLSKRSVLMIGSGETASLTLKYLHQKGARNICIAGRTKTHTTTLAKLFNATTIDTTEISQYLSNFDVIISATACPVPFITKTMVETACCVNKMRDIVFLDLAVPRNIETEVAALQNVYLYNIDDLKRIQTDGFAKRQTAAIAAEQLIDRELQQYIRKSRALSFSTHIHLYRNEMRKLAEKELKKAHIKLSRGASEEHVLLEFYEKLFHKFIHNPTKGLIRAAEDGRDDLFELTHYLFKTASEETESS